MKQRSRSANRGHPQERRRRRPSYKPTVERLEDRCLFAVTVLNEFTGLAFHDTQGFIPPDTCGAAGPVKYVETVNQNVRISNKADGSSPVTDTFSHLWYTTGGLPHASASSFLSDPIVVWDDQVQRFIVGDQDVDNVNFVSTFDLAVSKSASPTTLTTADWYFLQINTTENNGTTAVYDADYPGNFGWNADAFVFSLRMFVGSAGSVHDQINSVKISDLVNGTLTAFRNDFTTTAWDLRPTVMHDSVAGDPMWFVESTGGGGSTINVYKMTNVLTNAATFATTTLTVNAYSAINFPLQPDGSQVVTNIDTRIMKAAEWNGQLVATHHIGVGTTEDDARWYLINVSSGTPVLSQQGDVVNASTGAGTNNVYDYYPGIDINSSGDIGMSFMQSGTAAGQFMSVYVTGRTPTDPAGTMETPVLVQAGATNYHDFGFRAGDLSGINTDSDGSFWIANEYANTDASANWGTAIAHFEVQLAIISSIPANGVVLTVPPASYVLNFSEAVVPASLLPSALLVNGIAATSVALNGANTTATFTFSSNPVTTQGLQTMTVAANTITGVDGTGNAAFAASFRYDAITLAVTATNPTVGTSITLSGSSLTYDVTFNEPIDPATAATSNLTLSHGTVSNVTVLSGNQTVRYTITGLAEGTLLISIPAGQVKDAFDNPAFTPFSGSYLLDYGTVPYPTPLTGVLPPGSLVYTNTGIAATIGLLGDTDSFTLTLDAGQTITVLAAPAGTLQATVALRDPSSTLLGSATSTQPGLKAVLQTVPTTSAGVYTITVSGANGTIGAYTVQVILNAALEAESYDGPANNTLATAQSIDSGFVSLGGAASRAAVLGQADLAGSPLPSETEPNNTIGTANSAIGNFASYTGNVYQLGITGSVSSGDPADFFNLGSLPAGAIITISDSGAFSKRGTLTDPVVELYRAGSPNRVTFDDDSGPGLDALIYRFTLPVADVYYVRATRFGGAAGTYSLGVYLEDNGTPPAIGGTFTAASEPNDSIATANDASTSWRPMQYQASTTAGLTKGDIDTFKYQFTAGDVVSLNSHAASTLNTRVSLLNAGGVVLASEDGTSTGLGSDSLLQGIVIPSTGTYYVQVQAASGTGSYTVNVYLSTSTAPPRATNGNDYYAFTLAAGDTVTLAIKSLSSGTVNLTLQDVTGATLATGVTGPSNLDQAITDFTAPSAGTYYALVTGTASMSYNLAVTRNAEFDTEGNNSRAAAQPVLSRQVSGSQQIVGGITSGDTDYYKLTLAAGTALQAQTTTPGDGSGEPVNLLDPLLNLYNASGTLVASDDNSAGDGHNALLNYTVPTGQGGTYYLQVAPVGTTTGDYTLGINQAAGPVIPEGGTGLYVTSFTPMPGGFSASFSEPFVNSSSNPVHLYDAASAGYGAADVALVGETVGGVSGSLVIDPSNSSFTFVKTGGVLAPDTYTVTFRSGANAFEDLAGGPLNGDGVNPGNYVTTFTVEPTGAVVVRVPGFARGPDSSDPINVPNNTANGIPLLLSDGSGLTDATLVLQYNADLLNITGATVNSALAGASLTVTTSGSGSTAQATIVFQSPTPLDVGAVQLGGLTATVPHSAPYGAVDLLHFSNLSLNDGTIPAMGADGIQVVAFLGDTSGDGIYTSQDAVLLLQVAAHADRGFAAFPRMDPVLLADFNGNGSTDAGDGVLLNRYLAGTAVAQMPNYPGSPSNSPANVDVNPTPSIASPAASSSTSDGSVSSDNPQPAGSSGLTLVVSALSSEAPMSPAGGTAGSAGGSPGAGGGPLPMGASPTAPATTASLLAAPATASAGASSLDETSTVFQAAVDEYFAQAVIADPLNSF